MRHHRLPLIAGVVALGFGLAVAGCDASTSVGSYNVTYRADVSNTVKTTGGQDSVIGGLTVVTPIATIDSILYSRGTGKCAASCNADSSLIKVTNPAASNRGVYAIEQFLPSGATVQATLYGRSAGAAAGTAQFTVVWTTASGTVRGDSVTAQTATPAGTAFTLTLTKRTL